MEIITSHSRMDFDGMAGIIGASKLYPNAIPVRLRGVQTNVHQFISLHREHFDFRTLRQINFKKVERVILVDVHNPDRVQELKKVFQNPNVDIHVYDHHPVRSTLHPNISHKHIEMVGSTATLFTEILKERNIPITSEEATALAIGIYADTGKLTYLSTKNRDVQALAYLFQNHADISVINHFLNFELSREQKQILYNLFKSVIMFTINEHKIIMAEEKLENYVDGLSEIVMKLKHIEEADASFVIFHILSDNSVHIVTRSRVPTIDVGHVMKRFGGGGHYAAGYAKIRKGNPSSLRARLYRLLKEEVASPKKVEEAMTKSVISIEADVKISELEKIFEKNGFHGITVMEKEKLVGVISIRDVEKARKNDLLHAPVKGFMSKKPITICPDKPLEYAEEVMLKHNIGRLPVVKDKKLVGIITRTDILKHLYKNY